MNRSMLEPRGGSAVGSSAVAERTPTTLVALGVVAWTVCQLGAASFDLVSAVLAAGPLIVVPLAGDLFGAGGFGRGESIRRGRCRLWMLPAASLLAVAVGLPTGSHSAALAAPWMVFSWVLAAFSFRRTLARGDFSAIAIGTLAAHLYLAVGSAWALASCGGWTPGGVDEPIVRLTAVHFHYAGYALPAIAVRVAAAQRKRVVDAVALAVIVGVPLVAVGIASRSTTAELAATLFLGVAATMLAAVQMSVVFAGTARNAASMLAISSISLATAMTLAVVYAFGRFIGMPILDIATMVATHGLLNAVGFAVCGPVGWRSLDETQRRQ